MTLKTKKTFIWDYTYWTKKEEIIKELLEKEWFTVELSESKTSLHDLTFSKGKTASFTGEIKSRRVEKNKYKDTLIGANKLAEAYAAYYKDGVEPIFFFIYTDGIYYLNPFDCLERREYKLQRWDRGWIDKKKGWLYFNTEDLINIKNIWNIL